jgi:DNA-binding PadR family transcriptional regulator
MSVIDPGPDRYFGRRSGRSDGALLTEESPRLDVVVPASLLVLLALATGPLHAYGVARQVERDSGTLMGKGTVLQTLERLEEAGWIELLEGSGPVAAGTLRMTVAGRNALRSEIGRIHRLAALARERRILP